MILSFSHIDLLVTLGHGSAPDGSRPRGCERSLVIGCSRRFLTLSYTGPLVIGGMVVLPMGVAPEAASNRL